MPDAQLAVGEDITILCLRSLQEYLQAREPLLPVWQAVEAAATAQGEGRKQWQLAGECEVCGQPQQFRMDWLYASGTLPNYRERLVCDGCGLNNRQRFVLALIRRRLARSRQSRPSVYLYEQVTHFYQAARVVLNFAQVIGSEYLGFEHRPGEAVGGLRHEDAMQLSFADGSLDLVVSNDVLEHVPDFRRALAEAFRVLRPGGSLVFSIPFYAGLQDSRPRALLENGRIRHLLPEQYHGNPLSEKGSLVFHDFGWDILEACREPGFQDAYALYYHSRKHGYLGGSGQILFIAEKNLPASV